MWMPRQLLKRQWSARLPYGPYIFLVAVIRIFAGREIVHAMFPINRGQALL
jgi:prepilin signal peptidase PulO-like enzyme (type II secretory pathway)